MSLITKNLIQKAKNIKNKKLRFNKYILVNKK